MVRFWCDILFYITYITSNTNILKLNCMHFPKFFIGVLGRLFSAIRPIVLSLW